LRQAADEYLKAIPELSGEYYSIAGRIHEQLGDSQKALENYESAPTSDYAADSKAARDQIAGWIQHLKSNGR
jgi:tetratricopeptide (TPR) repeat protein